MTETLQFANALTENVFDLDHPLNANDEKGAMRKEPEEASLELRCFVVANGQKAYDSLIERPGNQTWRPEMAEANTAAELGVLAFKESFAEWIAEDNVRDLGALAAESLDRLRVALSRLG